MELIAHWISEVLHNVEDESVQKRIRSQVEALTEKFPLYESRRVIASKF
jgi:glycine/serine hydroxymethyltransferase